MGRLSRRQRELPRKRGFDLWFAFCAVLALGILAATAILLLSVASDPASLGRFIGSVSRGYNEQRSEARSAPDPAPSDTNPLAQGDTGRGR